jgi:putative addiction module component (TIGR02574 family)
MASETTFQNLTIAQRILLAQRLWDSVVTEQEHLGLTDAQREELDRRLDTPNAPEDARTWSALKRQLTADP